jgi:lysophospholipase L1-like esterase
MPELSLTQMRHLQQFFVQSIRDHPQNPVVIAEGDSWFSFPIHANIIDHLDELVRNRMSLLRLESSGDELIGILDTGGSATMKKLLAKYKPDVLLFSAGGNDIVGPELLTFVNVRREPFVAETAIATDGLARRFSEMEDAYRRLIAARDSVAPNCIILTHGYARAIPSGKKAQLFGISAGPWIKPFLQARGYTDAIEQRAIVDALIGRFNALLDQLAGPRFVKLNLRDVISDDEWHDELHPTRHGFEDAARVFLAKLRELLPSKFPV